MIKMLVTSFYHTLIDDEEAIPASTMLELDRIRSQKTKITIISNGLLDEVLYYNHDYPFIDYIIALNGGVLFNAKNNKRIYGRAFTKQEIKKITRSFTNKTIYYYDENNKYDYIPNTRVYKIAIKLTKQETNIFRIKDYKQSTFFIDNEFYLEISKNTSWDLLQKILEKEKIKPEELMCIIDNESEEDILKNIKKTFIIKNGLRKLKGIRLSNSNNERGVEEIIKKEIK